MDNIPIPKPTEANIQDHYKTTDHQTKQLLTVTTNQTKIGYEHILHGRISKDWESIATANWNKKEGTWTIGFINQTVKWLKISGSSE